MTVNQNHLVTTSWSNPSSAELYQAKWRGEPACQIQYTEALNLVWTALRTYKVAKMVLSP